MNILHVLDHSLPDVDGYAIRSHAIMFNQRRLGLHPAAVTSLWQRGGKAPTDLIQGISYHRTAAPMRVASDRAARDRTFIATVRDRVLERVRALGTNVVHAHSPSSCGTAAFLAARIAGLPIVYEIRASWEDAAVDRGRCLEGSPEYIAARDAEMLLAESVDAVVAISRGNRDDLVARGLPPDRIVVVPNGVDTDAFAPRPKNVWLAERLGLAGKTVIGYFGSFFRFEGVSRLLEALAPLCSERDDVRGLFVGDGETGGEVRMQAAALGLDDKVVFAGRVAPQLMRGLYGVADVVCYPRERCRLTELTTPLKPLEAMSLAKAVVASDVGGHLELLDDGHTAMLFRAGDADELSALLRTLVDAPELRARLGGAARAEVLARRDWRSIVRRYGDLYASLIGERSRPPANVTVRTNRHFRRTNMSQFKHSALKALSLTVPFVIGATAGCGSEDAGMPRETPAEETEAGSFPASAETVAASGITRWVVVKGTDGVFMEGQDDSGTVVNTLHLRVVDEKELVDGSEYDLRVFELTTSNGGLLRATADGELLEMQPDLIAFDALSRDIAPYMEGRDDLSEYGCGFWGWSACYAASAAAGVACAAGGPVGCAAGLAVMAATCGPCWASG